MCVPVPYSRDMKAPNNELLTGYVFGSLTVESFAERRGTKAYWNCRCVCGVLKAIRGDSLKDGSIRSCGCLRIQTAKTKIVNLVGRTFGRLTVTDGPHKRQDQRGYFWPCLCACGARVAVHRSALLNKQTQSCGCLRREQVTERARVMGEANTTHGQTASPEWTAWRNMRLRCTDPQQTAYPNYGGRGITVCARWESFENFVADMGEKPTPQHSLGRIDNNGHYCPENCRWETQKEQQRNRRDTVFYEYNGERRCVAEWAELYGLTTAALWHRIRRGWSMERALTTPVRKRRSS